MKVEGRSQGLREGAGISGAERSRDPQLSDRRVGEPYLCAAVSVCLGDGLGQRSVVELEHRWSRLIP